MVDVRFAKKKTGFPCRLAWGAGFDCDVCFLRGTSRLTADSLMFCANTRIIPSFIVQRAYDFFTVKLSQTNRIDNFRVPIIPYNVFGQINDDLPCFDSE